MGYLLLAGMISGLYLGQAQAATGAAQAVAGTLANVNTVMHGGVTVDVKNLERQLSQQQNTVYGEQQLTTKFSPVCNTCTVTWTSTTKELTGVNATVLGSKPYLFASGIKGVALSVRPTDNGELWVGLMNSSQLTEGPVAGNMTLPGLFRLEKGSDGITHQYPVTLTGNIIAPSCEMGSGQKMTIGLDDVTTGALQNVNLGEPLKAISGSTSFSLHCVANANLTMTFKGEHPDGLPWVLKATSDSNTSADSGVGFIVKATGNEKAAIWDDFTELIVPVVTGQRALQFTAMYTRTGEEIIPGDVKATGMIIVNFP
ncbi:fimbrial protein [Salmonella enterica]|nr:fimbrial protein [Salmonella enterica]